MGHRLGAIVLGGLVLLSTSAHAHVTLTQPMNRYGDLSYENAYQKSSPCGHADNPSGTQGPYTFAPGETITIGIDEYVGHTGFFRIAFAPSDQDFIAPSGVDDIGDDPSTLMVLPDEQSGQHQIELTLPNMECDGCVLQVIQVMTNGTGGFAGNYYQCADISLSGDPAPGTGGEETSGSSTSGGDSDSTTGTSTTGGGATSSTSGTGADSETETSGTDALPGGDAEEDSGCGCRLADKLAFGWSALGLLALLRIRRRRR